MGNEPSQRSKVAERALEDFEAELHERHARSPDISADDSILTSTSTVLT